MKYYLKKCWPTVTAASICMVVAYGLQVCTSLVQIQITQGLLDGDLRAFTIRIILLLLTWLAVVLCLIAETFFQGRAVRRMNNALRRDMAAGLLHKTHQEYHKQESGEYLSQFTNDVNQIEQMAWTPFFTIMGSAAQVVFGIVALASIHWLLLVISLVIALVMIFVPRLFSKRLGTVGTACAASQADSVSKIKDLLAGYDVLRFFGKDERFTSGVDAASDSMEQAKYKLTINKDGIGCGLAYVSAVCQVAVVILLGVLILNDMIPLATFMGTGTICAGVYNGLNQVSKLAVSFSASKPYFDKITIHAGEAQLPDFGLPTLQEGITVKDVSFGYDEKKPILVHMNAEFKKGGKYALTGPSGCGKSTLLKILLGWLPGYQGKVLYDERDVRDYTPEQLQQKMSYIEQNVFLFNTTIRENITLGEHFTDEQMEKALRDSALAGDLANMPKGLDTPVGEEGNALSGGQKQRVAIARALIHNRSILLVDEGTSALDQKNADIVEKSLLSNPDLTLILISHQNGQPPYWQNQYNNGQPPCWQNQPQRPRREKNSFATITLISGIFALLTLCCFAFPVAIICGVGAVCFAIISKKGQPFRGTAVAGIILGVIAVLLGIGEFFYVLTITNLMKDPANAAAFNEFFEQFQRQVGIN